MPIPFLLAGAAVVSGVLGAAGHINAQEINEEAKRIILIAQNEYEEAKSSLEDSQRKTEESLLSLGYSKKRVLNGSIDQFLVAYGRIKNVQLSDSVGLDEISNFAIEHQETLQLSEMSNIYRSTGSSAITGAAAGTVVALAASGSLPIVTGVLSTAGTALIAGEISMATGLAGSALSFGAAMTPFAAIAAPALLFSGISSSMKAEENLEKAHVTLAESALAVEKMVTAEMLCEAISERAEMFNNLLDQLNEMFSQCTGLLDGLTKKKIGIFKSKIIDAKDLTHEELKLLAITRSLAGAVKAVIDTPILSEDGSLAYEFNEVYENTTKELPKFDEVVKEVKYSNSFANVKPIPVKESNTAISNEKHSYGFFDAIRNLIAIIVGIGVLFYTYPKITNNFNTYEAILAGSMIYTITTLCIMSNHSKFRFFRLINGIHKIALGAEFGVLLFFSSQILVNCKNFVKYDLIFGFVSLILIGILYNNKKKISSLRQTLANIFFATFFFAVALLIFLALSNWIGLSFITSIIITEIMFVPLALASAFQ